MAGELRDSFRQALSELFLGAKDDDKVGSEKNAAPEAATPVSAASAAGAGADAGAGAGADGASDAWLDSLPGLQPSAAGSTAGADTSTIPPLSTDSASANATEDLRRKVADLNGDTRTSVIDAVKVDAEPAATAAANSELSPASTPAEVAAPASAAPAPLDEPLQVYDAAVGTDEIIGFEDLGDEARVDADGNPITADFDEGLVGSAGLRFSRPTIIAEGTIVDGSLRLGSPAEIYGILNGNATSRDDIFSKGEIYGNIIASNLDVVAGVIEGDVAAFSSVRLSSKSTLTGDVNAAHLDLRGELTGDSLIAQDVNIYDTAVLDGDMSAGSVAVGHGARIAGRFSIGQEPIAPPEPAALLA